MGRSRFPGKPFKFQSRRRISVLSGSAFCEDAGDEESCDSTDRISTEDDHQEEDKEGISKSAPQAETSKAVHEPVQPNQDIMEQTSDKFKTTKKSVTFGTVESCDDDESVPLKKLPSKYQTPLASIIKKRSCLKPESGYSNILKPAKLTDISSKLTYEGDSFKSSPFSQLLSGRSSPPPLSSIFARSSYSSRIIKPNRKFLHDSDEKRVLKSSASIEGHETHSPCSEEIQNASDSDGSWDSTSVGSVSDDHCDKEDRPTSQLLSGKVIIREARLQLGNASSQPSEGLFSTFTSTVIAAATTTQCQQSGSSTAPSTVTCGVCGAVRFYKFVKQARKFGIYTCESCRKFISKMLKKVKLSTSNCNLQCVRGEGKCHVPPVVRSQQWKLVRCANKARCPACWLKLCLKAFQMPSNVRQSLELMLPSYMQTGKVEDKAVNQTSPLRTSEVVAESQVCQKLSGRSKLEKQSVDEVEKERERPKTKVQPEKKLEKIKTDPLHYLSSRKKRQTRNKTRKKEKAEVTPETDDEALRQKIEIRGPRVKHVCRSASIVLGQPIATFSDTEDKPSTMEQSSSDDEDSPRLQVIENPQELQELEEKTVEVVIVAPELPKKNMEPPVEIEPKRRKLEEVKPSEPMPLVIPRKNTNKAVPIISNVGGPGWISIDFWRAYDLEEVCNAGLAIIASAPITLSAMCYLCASAGKQQLVYCGNCAEAMHTWCATNAGGSVGPSFTSRCPRCVMCCACNRPAARSRCRSCARAYHSACLRTKADWPQLCAACLKCKSCESSKVRKFVGSLPFCAPCFRLRQKGNYCPLCNGCYQDNDFDSKMMECGMCSRWVHAACERISGEVYQLLALLPLNEEYTCRMCTPKRPRWVQLINRVRKERLCTLLQGITDHKRARALLRLTPQKPMEKPPLPNSPSIAVRRLSFGAPSATVYRAYGNRVINLQEPLMQNKEICFYDVETDENPCVRVNDNNPFSSDVEMVSDENTIVAIYEPVSDDESIDEQDSSELKSPLESPSLLDIKKKVNSDEYDSIQEFNTNMKEVINRIASPDLLEIYRQLFSEVFPWFDFYLNSVKTEFKIEFQSDREEPLKEEDLQLPQSVQEDVKPPVDQPVLKMEECDSASISEEELYGFEPSKDTRMCVLCKLIGDGESFIEGRLLYCGQNDWIHANCALWSAEVFEEIDGSLQNVMSAISRGKMIKCAHCDAKGASVGCCAKNCGETYHYGCARKTSCAFLDDKRVFCPLHSKDISKKNLQKEDDFLLQRPIYVELDGKKKRYAEISKIQVLLGSLTVQSLGRIVPCVSDLEDNIVPVDLVCNRLFWSTKNPWKLIRYTIKTKLIMSEPTPGFDTGVNITLDHAGNPSKVERTMAEIIAWHKCLDMGMSTMRLLKNERSPAKVSLEEIAVKQVLEQMLDIVCRTEQDEDEPQNTADLLPPELKDAIFEDLNHDLLDGISMQDIFPKLMSYEDLLSTEVRNDLKREDSPDFVDELLNSRLEGGPRDVRKYRNEMQNPVKYRNLNRPSNWTNNLLNSTIKKCKLSVKSSTVTSKSEASSSLQSSERSNSHSNEQKELKTESGQTSASECPTQSAEERNKNNDTEQPSDRKNEYYTGFIDFYTKIQCSPISQLDGACDDSFSDSSSRPESPAHSFSPIPQLDGSNDIISSDINKQHTGQIFYRSVADTSYTVTIAGSNIQTLQPDLVIRGLEEVNVRCDRCQCTYRNKEMFDRHLPTCDIMSTSESESDNPRSPQDQRTLTTLQNAFPNFVQPVIMNQADQHKAETITSRRSSTNTRQITINGTIVETNTSPPDNVNLLADQVKGTVILDKSGNQVMNNPQIIMTQQMPINTSKSTTQKVITPQIIGQSGGFPYNICVKPGTSMANSNEMPQFISTPAGIQAVITSTGNQILTFPANQQNILQGKNIQNYPICSSSFTLPVNSLQSLPAGSFIQNIQPMMRTQMQGNQTIVVPTLTSSQNKPTMILPQTQKSPKKHPITQPKPIFQATRGRGRTLAKATSTIKRSTKLEKTIHASLTGNVIQLQPNNQAGQPSIIVQPVGNQNIMSAYVEALSQQQNQNMQYIATIAPQGDFKNTPTQFISTQGGLMPQTFQIQQTENGSLVAIPSSNIPILLSQSNVGILPQSLQSGTILSQGSLPTQGIISQGPNGPTLIPQTAIHTQNGTTIIPQSLSGNIPGNATILSNNNIQTQSNNHPTIVSQSPMQSQGAILPQFCNDQVILGSAPELQMVTDSSGCMFLTAAQPVYYGLETIVQNTVMQNTVMQSQQFVSTAMQGVLAQNSSFSATTTQVFQASKIEPIVEVPAGYVVVNADQNSQQKSNLTLQTITDKPQNKQAPKASQSNTESRAVITTSASNQQTSRQNSLKIATSSSVGNAQPIITIAQNQIVSNGSSMQASIPLSQPIVSTTIAPSNTKSRSYTVEVRNNSNTPVVNISPALKSPKPWQNHTEIRSQPIMSSASDNISSMPKLTITSGGIENHSRIPWSDNSFSSSKSNASVSNVHTQPSNEAIQNITPFSTSNSSMIQISSGNISQCSNPQQQEINVNKMNQKLTEIAGVSQYQSQQSQQTSMASQIERIHPHVSTSETKLDQTKSNANDIELKDHTEISYTYDSSGQFKQYYPNNQQLLQSNKPYYSSSENQRVESKDNQMQQTDSHRMLNVSQTSNQAQHAFVNNQSAQNRQFDSFPNVNNMNQRQGSQMLSQSSCHNQQAMNRSQNDQSMFNSQVNHSSNSRNQFDNMYNMQRQMPNNSHQHRLVIEEGNIQFPEMTTNNLRTETTQNVHQTVTNQINNRQIGDGSQNLQGHQMNASNRHFEHHQNQMMNAMSNRSTMNFNMNQHQMQNRANAFEGNSLNQLPGCSAQSATENLNLQNMGIHPNHQNLDAINVGIQSMNVVNQLPPNSNPHGQMNMNQMPFNNAQSQMGSHNVNMLPANNQGDMKNEMNMSSCAGNCSNMFSNQFESCSSNSQMQNMNMGNQMLINTPENSSLISNHMNGQNIMAGNQNMHNQNMYMMGQHVNNMTNANSMSSCNMNTDYNSGLGSMMDNNGIGHMHNRMNSGNQMIISNNQNRKDESKFSVENNMLGKVSQNVHSGQNCALPSMPQLSDCAKANQNSFGDKPGHDLPMNNQLGYMQINTQNNRIINISNNRQSCNAMMMPQQHNIRVMNNPTENVSQRNSIHPDTINSQRNETPNVINVPIRAIPNSAPMNINVNSSNNTVNITVQNNLVDPKIVGKGSHIDYTVQNNVDPHSNGSMICVQNKNITLPSQNSISLPKAPGIPTNVVNPMATRPMNRVLPLHRDQSKPAQPSAPTPPRPAQPLQDMPDLAAKEAAIQSDMNKAIEESKRMAEIENTRRETEALEHSQQEPAAITSLPSLDDNFEETIPQNQVQQTVFQEETVPKSENILSENNTNISKSALLQPKVLKKVTEVDKKTPLSSLIRKNSLKNKENKFQYHRPTPQPKDDGPKLIYEITSEDGFNYTSGSLSEGWLKLIDVINTARKQNVTVAHNANVLTMAFPAAHILGLHNKTLRYLLEQLPGINGCTKYRSRHGIPLNQTHDREKDGETFLRESQWGAARCGPVNKPPKRDMFSWLASRYRASPPTPPPPGAVHAQESDISSRRSATLPLAMRFRNLKETSKISVGVYRSHIHGRGLFCKRDIEEGEMVIEYAGEVIRAALADRREAFYESRRGANAGCYMFRVDHRLVVDATMRGNAARFINHSCDPNCYSKVVDIHGHKHIVIFALRRISRGEELTYDYKFPFEDDKIPCTCGAKKCKKYLN